MSNWQNESTLIVRFVGSGVFNTFLGFAVIFFLMGLGFSAVFANMGGYLVGILSGFIVSKKLVFVSNGKANEEGPRYLVAFILSYLANLLILHIQITQWLWNEYLSQIVAAVVYTTTMYVLSRGWVFSSVRTKATRSNG